jgi:MFS family permease
MSRAVRSGDEPPSLRDLRHLIVPIYVTAFAAVTAMSFVTVVLPIYAKNELGASSSTVGAIIGMQGLGSVCTAACAGVLIDRIGERRGILLGAIVRMLSYSTLVLGIWLSTHVRGGDAAHELTDQHAWALHFLFIGWFGEGVGMGTFQIARNSFVSAAVNIRLRGRANALIGGCMRLAQIIGPASGAAVYAKAGPLAAFECQTSIAVCVVLLLLVAMPRVSDDESTPTASKLEMRSEMRSGTEMQSDRESLTASEREGGSMADGSTLDGSTDGGDLGEGSGRARSGWTSRLYRYRLYRRVRRSLPPWTLSLLAVAPIGFSFAFARVCRSMLLPLKANSLQLSVELTGYLTSISFAVDSITFPIAGVVMDKYGRKAAGVPSLLLLAAGLALAGAASSAWMLVLASALLGIGNGLSSGLVQTVGQDAAPARARSRFIGLYKVCSDAGTFIGPLVVGIVTDTASLAVAAYSVSLLTVGAAVWYAVAGPDIDPDIGPDIGPTPQPQPLTLTPASDEIGSGDAEECGSSSSSSHGKRGRVRLLPQAAKQTTRHVRLVDAQTAEERNEELTPLPSRA